MDLASERLGLVVELVTLSRPLDDILHDLQQCSGDADAELVTLERQHVVSVLERYVAGEIEERTVEDWADAVELRDDVGLPDDETLRDSLFEAANPPADRPLTSERAKTMIKLLGG